MAKAKHTDPIPALEWIAAAFGLIVALALLAIIGRAALSGNNSDVPALAARVEAIDATSGGFVARIVVTNQSGQTAARVEIEGTAGDETSSASVDYVPGYSQAEGGLLFRNDPRRAGLQVRVTGYQLP